MIVSIYQINSALDSKRVMFFCLRSLVDTTGTDVPDMSIYQKVYELPNEREPENINRYLESLFRRFNIDHPQDYKGRSMSVSDIVSVETDGQSRYFFCDDFGFKEVNITEVQ